MTKPSRQRQTVKREVRQAPLRRIVERSGSEYATLETLECGHLHEPAMHPAYPERHLHVKRRRCVKCANEAKGLLSDGTEVLEHERERRLQEQR
jgi:hypothetical protein